MAFPNLKAEMARKGISISQMAAVAGVTNGTFYRWMNGKNEPSISVCLTIAEHLNQTVDYLFASESIAPSA